MKSRKSIFVVALAVLMLVAFTACEQPVPGLSTAVRDAEIVQTGTFFVDQPFDASKFSVNVTYTDGSKGTLSGNNVVYGIPGETNNAPNTADKVGNGDIVSVTLPTSTPNYGGNGVATTSTVFPGTLTAYTFNNVVVTGTESLPYDTSTKKYVGELELSVVATYKDGNGQTQSVTLVEDEDYTVGTYVAPTTDPTKDVAQKGSVTINLKFGGYVGTAANAVSYEFDATLYEAPAEDKGTPEWNHQLEVRVAEESSTTGAYVQRGKFDASKMIAVYKVMVNSKTGEKTLSPVTAASGETLSIELATPYTGTTDRFAATSTNTVNVTYTYIDDEVTGHLSTVTANATINTRADYLTSLGTATWVGKGAKSGEAYDVGDPIAVTDFTFNGIKWKSEITDNNVPASMLSVTPGTAPSLETQNTSYPVSIAYTNQSYKDSAKAVSGTVTVNLDPDFDAE